MSGLQRVSALKCPPYRGDLIKDPMDVRQGIGLLSGLQRCPPYSMSGLGGRTVYICLSEIDFGNRSKDFPEIWHEVGDQ